MLRVKDEYIDTLLKCKLKGFHLHSVSDNKMYEISPNAIEIDEVANKIETKLIDLRK